MAACRNILPSVPLSLLECQLRPMRGEGHRPLRWPELYHTLQISQARVTFTIFRFAGRSAESETLRFRSCVDAWARTCRGVLDTDSEGDATIGALCGSDDALTDAPPAAGSPSWLLRRCTPNIFGRETVKSWISAAGLDAYIQCSPQRLRHHSTQELARTGHRKGAGASRCPFPTTSGNRQEWCWTLFDGFSSGHLCMLSWRAVCGGRPT